MKRKRFQFDIRFLMLLLTLSSAATWWWVTWPERTWRRFVAAVESGDLDTTNRICDGSSLRFEHLPGTPIIQVSVRSAGQQGWARVTIDPLRFSGRLPSHRSAAEVVTGVLRTGPRGSFTYGHLEVRRNRVAFVK